ncbi:MAG: lipocalin-like domain-containing protein [Thermoanaerobaculia bacterium]
MRARRIAVCLGLAAAALLVGGAGAEGDDARRLVGSWRLVEWTAVDGDGVTVRPYGDAPQGRLTYGADGSMSLLLFRADRPAFESGDPRRGSDGEVREAFEGSFTYFGSWELEGDRVRHAIEACSFPNWTGTVQERLVRWRGDRLVLESPPVTSGGESKVHTLLWERAE